MSGRIKTLILAAVVTSAALVPLFGDPRSTPVTHPLWARMLLRSLDMTEVLRTSAVASQVFATLAWRDSLVYPADRYLREDGAVVREQGGTRVVTAAAGPAEVVYPVAVVEPGNYRLRARLEGQPQAPATAELAPLQGGGTVQTFTLVPATLPTWVFAGSAHLDPGAYGASFLLPPGCAMSRVEIAPPCLNPIEPMGGWRAVAVTTNEDLAVTALKALDAEYELPPDAAPIEIAGTDFHVEAPPEAVAERATATTVANQTLRAGLKGLRAIISFDIPEPGLYTLSAFVSPGSGQRWLVDQCRKAMVCPGGATGWRAILSQSFSTGRHTLVVGLADDAMLQTVRIEKKKASPQDYVAALRRLGFDAGPAGPISQERAIDAMRFLRDRRRASQSQLCGDTVEVDETGLPPAPQIVQVPAPSNQGPGAPPPPVIPPVPPPIGPPILPPQEPASPTQPVAGGG
jgi:hypothetical protein